MTRHFKPSTFAKVNLRTLIPLFGLILHLTSIVASAQEVAIPDPGLNAAIRETLNKPTGSLTEQDMLSLTSLSAIGRGISSVQGLEVARNLSVLDLDSNSLTNFAVASALTNLNTLVLFNNHLTNFVLPNGSAKLNFLDLGFNSLVQCSIPGGLTNLDTLFLEGNRLTTFALPAGLTALTKLDLAGNGLTSFALRADMTNLVTVLIFANQLTNVSLPAGLTRLGNINLNFNHLPVLNLPAWLTNLSRLDAGGNQLTNLTFPADMTNLGILDLRDNQLTNLTLPPNMTKVTALFVDGNPLTTFVLSEPLAATNLAGTVATLRAQGVSVITYPLAVQLISPRQTADGAFVFAAIGPPGVYAFLGSTDLANWIELGTATNQFGFGRFSDAAAALSPQKFYQARSTSLP